MATRRHRNSDKANEWAKKRAEAMALAKKRREERKRGQVSEEHTFKPQQISKPPSREGGDSYQNRGHPGVYDRNGRDVYYDRQNKSYPIPQNIQAQNGNYSNNFAPPQQQQHFQQFGGHNGQQYGAPQDIFEKPKISELDQLHMAGDAKFGKPRGYAQPAPRQQHSYGQQQQQAFHNENPNFGGPNRGNASLGSGHQVEDELDRFYAGQFENMRAQQQHNIQQRPRPSLQTDNLENNASRYGQVMSPNSDSLVHEARRVYNNPSIGRGGEGDFLQAGTQPNFQHLEEQGEAMARSKKHQEDADNSFRSWLRSDDDSKSKSISKSGWNSDFTDAGTLSRYDSEEHKPVKRKPARRKAKPVEKKRPEWNNDWADVGNATQHNSQESHMQGNRRASANNVQARQQPKQGGTYRKMINPSDILGSDSHGQGSMTPPQVSSRLRLLKKKVKRKESFSNGFDDQNVSSGNYNNVGDDSYNQYQQPMNHAQPARRTQHQRVQQHGWGGIKDVNRSSSGQVNYGADHEDPFGQNTSKTLSYHDIDNQPLGGGGGGGYNPRFDDADDGSYVQEVAPTQHMQHRNQYQQPNQQRQRQPQQRQRQPQQMQRQRRTAPVQDPYSNNSGYSSSGMQHDNYDRQPAMQAQNQQSNGDGDPPEFAPPQQLFACPHCNRKFNEKAHARHVPNCKKVFKQKRKPMDMTARRLEEAAAQSGNAREAIRNAKRAVKKGKPTSKKSKGPRGRQIRGSGGKSAKWKAQSQALREAMKASRMVSKYQKEGRLNELPAVESAPDPSFVPCPHCGRTFNEKAAERHIPRCKDIKAKPSFLKRGVGKSSSSMRRGSRRY